MKRFAHTAVLASCALASGGCDAPPVALTPSPTQAPADAPASAPLKAKPTLQLERANVAPGQTVWLGVTFAIDNGWHLYWNGRNDTGYAPKIAWTLPEGFEVGEAIWPAPTRHVAPGDIVDHIYEGSLTILVPLTVGKAAPGTQVIRAKIDWLVCEEACIPEEGEVEARIEVVPIASVHSAAVPAWLSGARQRVPGPWSQAERRGVLAKVSPAAGGGATLTISRKNAARIAFYPTARASVPRGDLLACVSQGPELTLEFPKNTEIEGKPLTDAPMIEGIVEIVDEDAGPEAPAWYWFSNAPPAGNGAGEAKK